LFSCDINALSATIRKSLTNDSGAITQFEPDPRKVRQTAMKCKSTGGRRLAEQAAPAYPNQPAPGPLRRRRRTRYVFVSSLPSPSATLAAPDEGAQRVTTEKGKRRIRREILSPYEMSLIQTAFGMSAQHTTSEPLRGALVKIAKKLTNIDRMIVEEDLD
jgi:hypothetical protein